MKGSEDITLVFSGKLVACIKAQIERRRMCLHEHVGHNDFVGKLGMLPYSGAPRRLLVMWIKMVAEIKPRPAIKSSSAHTADVVWRQIIAQLVPLVCTHPKLIAARPKCNPDGISNSPCIDSLSRSVGVELENAGAISFFSAIGNIRVRSD